VAAKIGNGWLIAIHSSASLLNMVMKIEDLGAAALKKCQVFYSL
jgi:hypothetical protein